jgi:uncharacterized protein
MAVATIHDDPVLQEAVEAVRAHYGDRVESIVLFGSRARGDHGPESDYDIAVYLRNLDDYWGEVRSLALISHDLMLRHGVEVVAMPFEAEPEARRRSLLVRDIENEGLAL